MQTKALDGRDFNDWLEGHDENDVNHAAYAKHGNDQKTVLFLGSLLSASLRIDDKTFETLNNVRLKSNAQSIQGTCQRKSRFLEAPAAFLKQTSLFGKTDFLQPMGQKWENAVNVFRQTRRQHND